MGVDEMGSRQSGNKLRGRWGIALEMSIGFTFALSLQWSVMKTLTAKENSRAVPDLFLQLMCDENINCKGKQPGCPRPIFTIENHIYVVQDDVMYEPLHEKTNDLDMGKTKTQISFAVTAKLICAFVFATWIVQYLYFLNPKFPASSHLQ